MKIHLLPPMSPPPPPLREGLRPTQLQAELAAEELIERAEKRRSEAAKRTVGRNNKNGTDGDRKEQETERNGRGIDVLV